MKKTKNAILPLVALSAALLAGCGSGSGPYAGHTRAWYEAHPKQMKKQLAWCKKQSFRLKEEEVKGDARYSEKRRLGKVCDTPSLAYMDYVFGQATKGATQ